jgi:hemolysin activation/secretion protein
MTDELGDNMKLLSLVLMLSLFCLFAFAQSVTEEQERIQHEQQRLIEEELRKRELEDAMRPPTAIDTPPAPEAILDDGSCIDISVITYRGNTIINNKQIDAIIADHANKCLSLNDINIMLQGVSNLYTEGGYVTSRAFMPMPQTHISEGVLEIAIVEGMISSVEGFDASEIFFAFPAIHDEVLSMRKIEQGLDQMNRLASNDAKLDIQADESREGYSKAIITNTVSDRSNIGIFLDNAGSESTGEWRAGLRYSYDNLFGINDQINLSYTKPLNHDYSDKDSNSVTVGLSVPFGYWSINNNASFNNNVSSFPLPISGELLTSTGETYTNIFCISYLVARAQRFKLSTGLGFTYRNTESYTEILDVKIRNEAASRRLSILNIEAPLTIYLDNGVLYVKPSYHRGMRWFDALDDHDTEYTQKAQFDLVKIYSFYSTQLWKGIVNLSFEAQYTDDELFGSETIYIGGEGSVRGYKEQGSQGDKGAIIRAEYTLRLDALPVERFNLSPYSLTAFVDYGIVDGNNTMFGRTDDISGAGMKFAIDYKYASISAAYAVALDSTEGITEANAFYLASEFSYTW